MARTLGWSTGKMSWFVGTLHVYERHYGVAERIVRHRGIRSLYDFGIEPLPITIGLDQLDATLDDVFAVDALAREGADSHARAANDRISDPFFRAVATLLRAHHVLVVRDDFSAALSVIDELPVSDLRLAALEYLSRRAKSTDLPLRQGEREYLGYLWAMRDAAAALVA